MSSPKLFEIPPFSPLTLSTLPSPKLSLRHSLFPPTSATGKSRLQPPNSDRLRHMRSEVELQRARQELHDLERRALELERTRSRLRAIRSFAAIPQIKFQRSSPESLRAHSLKSPRNLDIPLQPDTAGLQVAFLQVPTFSRRRRDSNVTRAPCPAPLHLPHDHALGLQSARHYAVLQDRYLQTQPSPAYPFSPASVTGTPKYNGSLLGAFAGSPGFPASPGIAGSPGFPGSPSFIMDEKPGLAAELECVDVPPSPWSEIADGRSPSTSAYVTESSRLRPLLRRVVSRVRKTSGKLWIRIKALRGGRNRWED